VDKNLPRLLHLKKQKEDISNLLKEDISNLL
jgi:hypothetical protein